MRTIVAAVAILCACFMQEVSGNLAVSSAPVNEATLKKEAESELMEETQGAEEHDDEDDAQDEEQDDDDASLAARLLQDAEDEEQDNDEDGKDESDEKVSEEDEEQDGADSEDEEEEQDEEDEDATEDEKQTQGMLQYMKKRVTQMTPSVQSLFAKFEELEKATDVDSEKAEAAADKAHKEFLGRPSAKVEKLSKENQNVETSKKTQEAEDQAFMEFSEAFAKELGVPMKGLEATVKKLAMEDAASAGQVLKPIQKHESVGATASKDLAK